MADVTIEEIATDVASDGSMIWLGEAMGGVALVILRDTTVFRLPNGQPARLQDVEAGHCIRVLGQRDARGALVARQVLILGQAAAQGK